MLIFGALASFGVLRELGYDTPFVVSSKIGENALAAVMRAGAQDCVTKEDMARLCPTVERELREVGERRRAAEALRFLFEASAELSSSLEYRATLAGVARLTVPRLAATCAPWTSSRRTGARTGWRWSSPKTPRRSWGRTSCSGAIRPIRVRREGCPKSCAANAPNSTPRSPLRCRWPQLGIPNTTGSCARSAASSP
jgi:hypothetical protein